MVLIVISKTSHFLPPTLTIFWQDLCPYFPWCILSSSAPTNIYFVGAKIFFVSCILWGLGKFQISWDPSVLGGGPNFLFGTGGGVRGQSIFFHNAINDQSGMLTFLTFTLLEGFLSVQVTIQNLKKNCLLLFADNSVKV